MNNGYEKMIGRGTVSALANKYSFSVFANTTLINSKT
jgi:hypothetical protein